MGAGLRQVRSHLASKWVPLGARSGKCLPKVEVGGRPRAWLVREAKESQAEKRVFPKENALGGSWV